MIDHSTKCPGITPDMEITSDFFRMEIIGRDKDPLRRVLREAVRIKGALEGEEFKVTTIEEEIEITFVIKTDNSSAPKRIKEKSQKDEITNINARIQ